jgi:hypothetical protein
LIFLVLATHHDLERIIEQRPLQRLTVRSDISLPCPYRKSKPLAVDRESGDAAARCLICAN